MRRGRVGAAPRRGGGGGDRIGTRFKMRQKIFAIGDDFWIENEQGQKVFEKEKKL